MTENGRHWRGADAAFTYLLSYGNLYIFML